MTGLRRHLTYANVMATLTAFVVLAGGTAIAANQLGKGSVGKKQLKANAVTTAKIKKNAVTAAKIKAGAVDGVKVKAGSLGAGEFQLGGMPYTHIAQELRTTIDVSVASSMEPAAVPLPGASYTQEAGRTDSYLGAVDVTFQPGCTGKRAAVAYLLMDAPPGFELKGPTVLLHIVALGIAEDNSTGQTTKRINLASYAYLGTRFAPATAQNHTFTLALAGLCEAGGGVTAGPVAIDVIGTR